MSPTETNFRLERELHFSVRGEHTMGGLFVGDLKWVPSKGKWACHWSIAYIHPELGQIYGEDPLDTVVKTLDFLSSLIRGSEADGLEVWWRKSGDHGGISFTLCESRSWEGQPPQSSELGAGNKNAT